MKYLFIGGQSDGQRIEVPEDLPVIKRARKTAKWGDDGGFFQEEIYQHERLLDTGGEYGVYVCTSTRGRGVVSLLISGYQKQP